MCTSIRVAGLAPLAISEKYQRKPPHHSLRLIHSSSQRIMQTCIPHFRLVHAWFVHASVKLCSADMHRLVPVECSNPQSDLCIPILAK